MKKQLRRTKGFAVCINNRGYLASLEVGKLYAIVPDVQAARHGLIRVIDESGEDYGYSAERFFILTIPSALEKALKGVSSLSTHSNSSLQQTSRGRRVTKSPTAQRAPRS
jgi:hypothetical protein